MSIFYQTNHQIDPGRKNLVSLYVFAAVIMAGLFIFNLLGLLALMPLFDFDYQKVVTFTANPLAHSGNTLPLLVLQAVISGGAFIVAPLVFLYGIDKSSLRSLNASRSMLPVPYVLVITAMLIVLVFMPFNGLFIDWNKSISLPDFMKGIERWAMQKEENMGQLTEAVTDLKSTGYLLLGLVVIALLPAIGEELVFRGIIQNKTFHNTGNIHLSVWLTAFLFSAVHMQFYGFVPRMLLGALFGYLYYWSGSFAVPVAAHFFNNAFTLLMINLKNRGIITVDIESTENVPLPLALASALLSLMLLLYFKKMSDKKPSENRPDILLC